MKQNVELEHHKIVFLFSGQGSQYRGMGAPLFKAHPIFRASMEKSDAIVRQQLGRSLIEELYASGEKELDELLLTHPGILAIEIAMLNVLKAEGISFDYALGSSLGEFAAATACGVWSETTALEGVIEQAKSICQGGTAGGMVSVLRAKAEDLAPLIEINKLYLVSENFPGHFTVSGAQKNLADFQQQLDEVEIPYLRLPVAYPFHSPLIESGKTEFSYYSQTHLKPFQAENGFISGLYAQEMKTIPEDYFWQIIRQPINFMPLVNYLERKGPCLYIDLGPSGTLANFIKYNLPKKSKSISYQILTPYQKGPTKLAALCEMLRVNH